ncbi:MAG: alpha/beta hydrolase [Duncaniella sp.]|nr:alpha/beta hydrolase [Duncaniella sp.]
MKISDTHGWTPDILGDNYEHITVHQPDDYDGNVVTTVVRLPSRHPAPTTAILYVHGFNDYFFQKEMGERFVREKYGFYAVDLRRYGRSILPGLEKFKVKDLTEYFPDLRSAINIMTEDGVKNVVILAHSTGGLITSLFMEQDPPGEVKALMLNSPFLAWNLPPLVCRIGIPAVKLLSRVFPRLRVSPGGTPKYSAAISSRLDGEWDYSAEWKPDRMPKVATEWIRAIDEAQREVERGTVKVPVLLMHSDRSAYPSDPSELFHRADGVLNVDNIAAAGRRLGPDVTEVTIHGGLHDLLLSSPKVRDKAYRVIFDWMHEHGL